MSHHPDQPSHEGPEAAALVSGVGDVDASDSVNCVAAGKFGKLYQGNDRSNFGQQTNTKHTEVNTIEHATITNVHHHYGGADKDEEPSTSGSQTPKTKLETSQLDEGIVQISDDIFINTKKPLRKGMNIYEGYQEHVTGQKLPLAIKAIAPYLKKNIREVDILVNIASHPNVVRIIRSKEQQTPLPTLYIVMELCSPITLQDYLKEKREKKSLFDLKKAMSYSKGLIRGMQHIHGNRIIHGDIKPQNILFSLKGDQIKVADFGISKQLQQLCSATDMTSTGTHGYRAPETYDADAISLKADIFPLGITLYSIFTNGKHPFGEDSDLWMSNIKKNTGRDLSGLPEEIRHERDEFLNLLGKMLEFDPKKRPTIEEISEHPFFSSNQASTEVSSTGHQSLGTSPEDPFPEPPFVVSTTPESFFASDETQPKEGGELVMRRQDYSPVEPSHPRGSAAIGYSDRDVRTVNVDARLHDLHDQDSWTVNIYAASMPVEVAGRLIRESKVENVCVFEEVIDLLKDLPGNERQQIMLAETFFRVQKDVEARECIERLKDIMASSSPQPNPNDVIKTIENYSDGLLFIRALILLPCASKLCTSHPDSSEALGMFVLCAWRCSEVIQAMSNQRGRMRAIAADTGIKTVHTIHADLQGFHGADPARKADIEARCLKYIAISYDAVGKLEEAIKYSKNGYDLMKSYFGPDASKYFILTRLLWNRASLNMKLGNYHEVEKLCLECLTVEELAEDLHQKEKEKIMKGTRSLLKDARQMMKNDPCFVK